MDMSDILHGLAVSALPLVELRASIPLLIIAYDVPWYWALLVCFVGNLLPIPFLLLLLEPVSEQLRKVGFLDRIMDWVFERTRRKGGAVEKYGPWGLVLVVAIPLPGTGAWTGSILAYLMGMPFKRAFPPIALGVLIAGVVVTAMSVAGLEAWLLYSGD
jgi:uncharacterized membrane protein